MKILAIETSCDETAAAVVKDGTDIISSAVATSADMHEKWGGIVPEVAAREQLKSIIPVIIEALQPFINSSVILGSLPNRRTTPESESLISSKSDSGCARGLAYQNDSKNTGFSIQPYKHIIEKNIDAIAVTVGPGLIGSLLIGVETAKTIAYICRKPIIPVNHVLAHMYANLVQSSEFRVQRKRNKYTNLQTTNCELITYPAISLVVSGGHTELYLMKSPKNLKWLGGTIDDAAGEAFDKTARLLGFGSRGGLAIQEAAALVKSNEFIVNRNIKNNQRSTIYELRTVKLPRPILNDETLNFSFSGLKTAILREWNKYHSQSNHQPFTRRSPAQPDKGRPTTNHHLVICLAYETQEAITDVLVAKTMKAVQIYQAKSIMISGGVSANLRLREKFLLTMKRFNHAAMKKAADNQLTFHCPPISLCTDNAVYIASYAYFRSKPVPWQKVKAQPDLPVEI